MRSGDSRRSLERWRARADEVQRLQDKKEQAWDLYRRVLSKRREDFENEFHHRVTRNSKADEKLLQDWTDEMQSKVSVIERRSEAWETKQMEIEDFNSQQGPDLDTVLTDTLHDNCSSFTCGINHLLSTVGLGGDLAK